jgi:hypothetical protein
MKSSSYFGPAWVMLGFSVIRWAAAGLDIECVRNVFEGDRQRVGPTLYVTRAAGVAEKCL